MADSNFTNFFNGTGGFGITVKAHERTLQQVGETLSNTAGGVFEPLFTYLEENDNVFSGDLTHELNKCYAENFNMTLLMNAADEKVNGPKPTFDTKF